MYLYMLLFEDNKTKCSLSFLRLQIDCIFAVSIPWRHRHTSVNSVRASLGEIHAMYSAQMAGELAGAVLASYDSHNLRKISPTDRYWSPPGWLV